jgi:hypothetical protein
MKKKNQDATQNFLQLSPSTPISPVKMGSGLSVKKLQDA